MDGVVVDTCGTGGSGANTFNISTATAFVAAGAGLKVAKHGNRAASGTCGSADVLEALGVELELGPSAVEKCINQVGIGFMFAPIFHPAMKYAAPVRREMGIRTVFNVLGPLTNPAMVKRQLLGVAHPSLGEKMARVLQLMGVGALSGCIWQRWSGRVYLGSRYQRLGVEERQYRLLHGKPSAIRTSQSRVAGPTGWNTTGQRLSSASNPDWPTGGS